MILQPQRNFPISRQISNHLDVNTYYVQAKVYNADGDLINTVNLEDKGSQRFLKGWRVPVDGSGQGTYVSIITSVFTDSNYTTKSSNYGDEENTYLIFDRVTPTIRGGAGSSGPSLADIKRVVGDEMDKREKEEEEMEIPDYHDAMAEAQNRVDRGLQDIKDSITAGLKPLYQIPTEETDLTHILSGIQNLAEAIDKKEVTPATDLDPLITDVESMRGFIQDGAEKQKQAAEAGHAEIKEIIVSTMEDAVANTDYVHETSVRPVKRNPTPKPEGEEKKEFNLRQLVS